MPENLIEAEDPSFLSALTDDTVLESSFLSRPLVGRKAIGRLVRYTSKIYGSKNEPIVLSADGTVIAQYHATLRDGFPVYCVVVLTYNADGEIVSVRSGYSPFEASKRIADEVRDQILEFEA